MTDTCYFRHFNIYHPYTPTKDKVRIYDNKTFFDIDRKEFESILSNKPILPYNAFFYSN